MGRGQGGNTQGGNSDQIGGSPPGQMGGPSGAQPGWMQGLSNLRSSLPQGLQGGQGLGGQVKFVLRICVWWRLVMVNPWFYWFCWGKPSP